MSKSSRRIMRATAAVIGMSAIGAMGSGTAFAETAPALDGAPDVTGATGATDLTEAQDGLGAVEEVGGTDLHSFEMPSVADQSVKSAYLARRHHDGRNHRSHRDHGHHHRGKHHRHH